MNVAVLCQRCSLSSAARLKLHPWPRGEKANSDGEGPKNKSAEATQRRKSLWYLELPAFLLSSPPSPPPPPLHQERSEGQHRSAGTHCPDTENKDLLTGSVWYLLKSAASVTLRAVLFFLIGVPVLHNLGLSWHEQVCADWNLLFYCTLFSCGLVVVAAETTISNKSLQGELSFASCTRTPVDPAVGLLKRWQSNKIE